MLVLTISKEEYENNSMIERPEIGVKLRPSDASTVTEVDFGAYGGIRYRLEYDDVEFAPPLDFKFGLQKEAKPIFKKKDKDT